MEVEVVEEDLKDPDYLPNTPIWGRSIGEHEAGVDYTLPNEWLCSPEKLNVDFQHIKF